MTVTSKSIFANIAGVEELKTFSMLKWCSSVWRPVLSELISTTLLVCLGCMTCIPFFDPEPPMYSAVGFGLVVMLNIQIFGHISGAHMNPVVTLASIIWGDISIGTGVLYVIVQCLGSTLGYLLLVSLVPADIISYKLCVTLPRTGMGAMQAFGVEAVLTTALILLCCGAWDKTNSSKQDSMPLKFGFGICCLSLAGGPLTGASMNPARSFGPALVTGTWQVHWIYWIAPFVGGIIGVILYKLSFVLFKDNNQEKKNPSNILSSS